MSNSVTVNSIMENAVCVRIACRAPCPSLLEKALLAMVSVARMYHVQDHCAQTRKLRGCGIRLTLRFNSKHDCKHCWSWKVGQMVVGIFKVKNRMHSF